MAHVIEIVGSEIEGFWFKCLCNSEGLIHDARDLAEMEGSVHLTVELL